MKATKLLSLLLALLMVCSLLLVACSGDEKKTNTQDLSSEPTEEQIDPNDIWDLETHDLQGHEFYFLVRESSAKHLTTNEVYAEALTNDTINDAVYRRNALLQQKYNCTVMEERTTKISDAVREPLMAGEYTYDVIYESVSNLRTLNNTPLLVDLNSVENLQLDKNWWDQNLRQGLSVAGKSFVANGDAGTSDDRASQLVFVNRDLIERNNQEDPYDLVKSGNWTIEKMYEISEACIRDEDGDGLYTVGDDIFATIIPGQNNWAFLAACGVTVSSRSSTGDIQLPATLSQDLLNIWTELRPLLTSPHRDVSDSGIRFRAGQAPFFSMNLGSMENLGEVTFNWGVIPHPKRNAEQAEYYSIQEAAICFCYAIPVTVDQMPDYQAAGFESGREMVGYFLNAMGYESRDTLTPAYYNQVVMRQMVPDEETADMLQLALKNKVYDPVIIYGFIGTSFFRDVGCGDGFSGTGGNKSGAVGSDAKYDTLTSAYESKLSSARTALKNYITSITAEETNAES